MSFSRKGVHSLRRYLFRVTEIVSNAGMVMLMAMVLLLVANVVLRRIFNSPLSWSLEVVKVMLVVVAFFSVAYCGTQKGHVSVDILTSRFPPKARAILDPALYLIGFGLFAFITWGSIANGLDTRAAYRITGILPIPIYPFVFALVLGSALLALVLLVQFIVSIVKVEGE